MLITLTLTYIVTFVLSFIFLVWNDCNFITITSLTFLGTLKRFWKSSLGIVTLMASAVIALIITFAVFVLAFAFPDAIRSHDIRNQLIEVHRNSKCTECRWMDMGVIQYNPTTNKFIKSGFETYKWVSCNKLEKELEEQLNK